MRYPHLSIVLAWALLCSPSVGAQDVERPYPAEWYAGTPEQQALHAAMEGQPMPEIALEDWINGQPTAADFEGKIVVVDFWAIWCVPCIVGIPEKNRMAEDYAEDGLVVIGIYGAKITPEKYASVVEDKDIRYPVGRDVDKKNTTAWRAMWMPTYAVIDRAGVVRAIGLAELQHVKQVVEALLEEQPAGGAGETAED